MLFFKKKPPKRPAEPLQLHQYLALLDGGMASHEASPAVKQAALARAREVWTRLELDPWKDIDPAHIHAWRNTVHGHVLVHVPTGIDDCFLIVVFDDASAAPVSHILFDIGAEYAPAILSCPAFEFDQVATEADIRRIVPQLPGCTDSFAVLGFRGGTYMQVAADGQDFHLEHQLVTMGAHYRCAEAVSADQAVAALISYGFGHHEWARTYRWERMDL